jgi:hypothetical protein
VRYFPAPENGSGHRVDADVKRRLHVKRLVLILVLLLVPAVTMAQSPSLDIGFNDNSAQLQFNYPLLEDDYGTSLVNARALYNSDEDTTLGSLGFDFTGEPGNVPGLNLGAGAQLYGGDTHSGQDFIVLGVGTRMGYAPPFLGGFGIDGKIFYGPNIFSFLDAERLLETGLRISYAITPKVKVHLGYQNIRTDFEDYGTWTIDEGLRLGFEARF